jgi:hypothetical protein
MTKPKNISKQNTVLVVNTVSKNVKKLRQDMPDWLWIEAPKRWPFEKENNLKKQQFQAIIVFADQGKEAWALAICKQISEKQLFSESPILLAGSRYQMALAHAVKRLPRGNFIFTPIEEKTLLNAIENSQIKQS